MDTNTAANFHLSYMDVTQHWSPNSESYAGGDQLVTSLFEGWEVQPIVYLEQKWYEGLRHIKVYHMTLKRGEQVMTMPVIYNPYVMRLINQLELRVVPIEERDKQLSPTAEK